MWYNGPIDEHPSVPKRVVRIGPSRVRALREDLDYNMREAFRRHHHSPSYYQIHHVLPLSLGGTNSWENLVMVHPKKHRKIHEAIDSQIEGMLYGESRLILLPVYQGKVWNRNKELARPVGFEPTFSTPLRLTV